MFLHHKFLKYGKPLAAAAPIVLALTGLPSPAHACTGNADDPEHCINNNQAINGFTEFYDSNLAGLPGASGVPGDRAPGDDLGGFLEAFVGLGGTPTVGEPGGRVRFGGSGRFGLVYDDGFPDADFNLDLQGTADNGLTFSGTTDNGLTFRSRIRIDIDEGETDGGVDFGGRIRLRSDEGGTEAADIDSGELNFNADGVADNGLRFTSEIRFSGGGINGTVEEYNTFISGSFGSIRIGAEEDTGTRGFSLGAPDSFAPGGVFRPQITLDNGLTIGVDVDSGRGAAVGIPEGGDEPRITYFNPRFAGFNIGVNYDRVDTGESNLDPTTPRDTNGVREFNIRRGASGGFGDLRVGLSERWGVDSAATNFAVGQASVAGYGEIEGIGIKNFGYVPLEEFNIHVDYNLDGSITTTDTTTGESLSGTTSGGAPSPAPVAPPPVTGTQVGTMDFANQGQRSEVNLIRTEDGKTHAVDAETGHDFGTVHESRSGFGWSFDNTPIPAPAPATPATASNAPSGTTGGNTPSPSPAPVAPPPVTGTEVGTMSFANQGQRSEVNLIRTEDGKTHAVDAETGHDFGTVHESRSGFGWSFDNPPVPAPAPATAAVVDPIATLDQETPFSDGFEGGSLDSWSLLGPDVFLSPSYRFR